MVLGAVFIIWALTIETSLRYLCLGQNNGYKTKISKRFLIWFFLDIVLQFPIVIAYLFLWENDAFFIYLVLILYEFSVFIGKAIILRCYRTKVHWTSRAKVTIVATGIISALVLSFLEFFVEPFISVLIYPTVVTCAIIPYIIAKAIISFFYEKKNNKFIEKAKRKIQSKDLIVIGITSSFGKTSCKNILKEMLSDKYNVVATPKNYNTPMVVSLTFDKM